MLQLARSKAASLMVEAPVNLKRRPDFGLEAGHVHCREGNLALSLDHCHG